MNAWRLHPVPARARQESPDEAIHVSRPGEAGRSGIPGRVVGGGGGVPVTQARTAGGVLLRRTGWPASSGTFVLLAMAGLHMAGGRGTRLRRR